MLPDRRMNLLRKCWQLVGWTVFIAAGLQLGRAQVPIGTVDPPVLWSSDPTIGAYCPRNNVEVLSASSGGKFVCHAGAWASEGGAGGSMVYPAAGVANSTGSAWSSSYTVGTGPNNLVKLDGSSKLPAVDGSQLTNLPSGGGATATVVTTTFSTTPTFSCPSSTTGTTTVFKLSTALTANVTGSTLAGCTAGQLVSFEVSENSAGGFSFVYPTNVLGAGAVDTGALSTTYVSCVYDGTNCNVSSTSYSGPNVAAGSQTLYEKATNGNTFVRHTAPDARATSMTFVEPTADPTAGQFKACTSFSAGICTEGWITSVPAATYTIVLGSTSLVGSTTIFGGGCSADTANVPTAIQTFTGSTYGYPAVQVATAVKSYVYCSWTLPATWGGAVSAALNWAPGSATGNVFLTAAVGCVGVGSNLTSISYNADSTVTSAAGGVSLVLHQSAFPALNLTGCSAGNLMIVRLGRDGTNGAQDTDPGSVFLHSLELTIQ